MPQLDLERLKDLLDEAGSLPPLEQAALLNRIEVQDPALAAELRRLLATDGVTLSWADAAPSNVREIELPLGHRLGAWEVLSEVARGGMGRVYLGRRADGTYNQLTAIKVVDAAQAGLEGEARFRREWRLQASLIHPNIAQVLDAGVSDGLLYLVMELVDGVSLEQWARQRPRTIREKIEVIRESCRALSYAHARLVVHRDIKPSNILLDRNGKPKIIDFGIAGQSLQPLSTATLCHRRMTPRYASPEQLAGDEWITTQSDVYSLGVVLYELLAGRTPWDDGSTPTPQEVWATILGDAPAPPSSVATERIPADLDAIVLKAIASRPEDRYHSIEQMGADLDRYLAGLPVSARASMPWTRAAKFVRRNTGMVTAAVIVVAVVAALSWNMARQRRIAQDRYQQMKTLTGTVLNEIGDHVWAMPGGVAARRYIAENQIRFTEALLAESPDDLALRRELIQSLFAAGTPQGYPSAENSGDRTLARRSFDRALQLATSLAAESTAPEDQMNLAHALNYSGWMDATAGNLPKADQIYERAVALNASAEADTDSRARILALSLSRLAWIRALQGSHAEAGQLHMRALSIRRRALERDPASRRERRGLSLALDLYGDSLQAAGQHTHALEVRRETLEIEDALLRAEPASIETRYYTARALLRTGQAEIRVGIPSGRERIVRAGALLAENRRLEPQGMRSRDLLREAETELSRLHSR